MAIFNFGKPKDEALENKIQRLNQEIAIQKAKLTDLKAQIKIADDIVSLNTELSQKRSELFAIQNEISLANDTFGLQEFGFFERQYKFSDSTKYKEALDNLRKQQKDLVKSGQAGRIIVPMLLDNNQSKGRAMQNQLIKAAIRGFNGEADALLVKVSVSNVENKIGKEYFNTIRERVKYIIKYSSTVNGKIVCKADSFVDRMIFIIAGLDNVYKNKVCAEFFCADEEIENDLIFSRKIYELLKI